MAQTFCKKIPLHRQFADLLIQRGQLRLVAAASSAVACPRANSDAVPSINVFFHAWIWLACTPYRLDSSATVPSSRTAANATFALKSGRASCEYSPSLTLATGRFRGDFS